MFPEKLNFLLVGIENIVGKRENVGRQRFLLFPAMFSTGFFKVVKSPTVKKRLRTFYHGAKML